MGIIILPFQFSRRFAVIEAQLPLLAAASVGAASDLVRTFAITMGVAGASLVLFRLLRLPPVLGYLLAGIIISPFILPDSLTLPDSLADTPGDNTSIISLLADLGLALLLFGIGLEFGWQRIRRIGSRVILIGLVEMTIMFTLGYQVGTLLGWTGLERVFLGASLSISSSAILVKMLRDTGTLFAPQGQLIVGILVVEDFVAVVLLTVLSGVASTGAANLGDVGSLIGKLALFGVAALAFGGLLAPRLIHFVKRFESDETLLITSLALCFGLALAAQELGLSGAAGAFLIGMVIGDTDHAEEIARIMSPVRDMFAALFFVSIGMLMDLSLFADFAVPALIISAVFIAGKVLADTTGTLLSGHNGRTSLSVGMGMPQLGEFSLAIAKVGAEQGVVGAYFNPVITMVTALTALLYPFIFRSTTVTANFLDRNSPRLLKQYGDNLFLWLATSRSAFRFQGPRARRIQHAVRLIVLNLGIIVLFLGLGTGALQFTLPLSELVLLKESIVGLIIGSLVLALCVPPAVAIWRYLHNLTEGVAGYVSPHRSARSTVWAGHNLRLVLRDSILILIVLIPTIWSIPFIYHLFSLGSVAAPLPILLLVGLTAGLTLAAFQIHRIMEATFSRTFLGLEDPRAAPYSDLYYLDDDPHLHGTDNLDPERSDVSDGDAIVDATTEDS